MRPWNSASPHTPQPTCTSCDFLTDFNDVTIFFQYLFCIRIVGVLFPRAFRKLTIYSLSLFRKFTCVKAAGHRVSGTGRCPYCTSTATSIHKDEQAYVRTLSAAISLSRHFLLSANFGLLSLSCLCQLTAKGFNFRSDCTRIYSPAFSPVAFEHQVWKLHHYCSLI